MYLNSINYFRAIAIILIVAGHCKLIFPVDSYDLISGAFFNLVIGGTSLFVFISGFLFHHIFLKKFHYKEFMIKKSLNVFFPYTILSILPIFYYSILKGKSMNDSEFLITQQNASIFDHFILFFKYLWTGDHMIAFWYIPFIMVVFLMSPLHYKFTQLKNKYQLLIVFILIFISLFIHRPEISVGVYLFQAIVYFTPVYLIGIMASQHKNMIYEKFKNREIIFVIIAILLAVFQSYGGKVGNYGKMPFVGGGIDLMLLQKINLCFFFMVWLRKFENTKNKFLEKIASLSFGIFFIHGFIILFLRKIFNVYQILPNEMNWVYFFLFTLGIMGFSVGIALFVKKVFQTKSRYLIGC